MLVLPGYSHFVFCLQHLPHEASGLHTHTRPTPKSAQRQSAMDRCTFGDTLLAMFSRHTSLHLLLLKVTTFPGSLFHLPVLLFGGSPGSCSLSHTLSVIKTLTLLPLLMHIQNMCVITLIDFHCSLIGQP